MLKAAVEAALATMQQKQISICVRICVSYVLLTVILMYFHKCIITHQTQKRVHGYWLLLYSTLVTVLSLACLLSLRSVSSA